MGQYNGVSLFKSERERETQGRYVLNAKEHHTITDTFTLTFLSLLFFLYPSLLIPLHPPFTVSLSHSDFYPSLLLPLDLFSPQPPLSVFICCYPSLSLLPELPLSPTLQSSSFLSGNISLSLWLWPLQLRPHKMNSFNRNVICPHFNFIFIGFSFC